jgi:hypothetical protein
MTWDVSCTSRPLHPWWKCLGFHLTEGWWVPEPVWTIWRRENLVTIPEIERRITLHPFPTLVTKPNELPRLQLCFFKVKVNITFTNTLTYSKWWSCCELNVYKPVTSHMYTRYSPFQFQSPPYDHLNNMWWRAEICTGSSHCSRAAFPELIWLHDTYRQQPKGLWKQHSQVQEHKKLNFVSTNCHK